MTDDDGTLIEVKLTKRLIGDLIYQQLEDEDDVDAMHARHVIDFAVEAMDHLGLIVR
jgi:hypothetical protein